MMISKSKLKANMLEVFREIEASGEELIVTHHNRPVLRIVPIRQGRSIAEAFADLRGQAVFHEDPDTPTIDEWDGV
ncbi:MAG: type II toxin-antitoxin system Phd/YefM family antitoxin [Ardenticatenaceae bacterium]|nr:type II toxin-antitoxin system Phd/YefM family antitoxin [Ardenticatenaceae bacterium]